MKSIAVLIVTVLIISSAEADSPTVIVSSPDATYCETLAARETARYVYLRTGQLLQILEGLPESGDAILLEIQPQNLEPQQYRLFTSSENSRRILKLTGGDPVATLYAAYRFAEHLGVRFYLHGDVIPDRRLQPWRVPLLDEQQTPLFELRGIQPFHDFAEGPDWWNLDDYRCYLAQLVKLRMNFFGLHCYPEGHAGPEPTVWIGLSEDCDSNGNVSYSYPSRYASTRGGAWGYDALDTSAFAAGAGRLFAENEYGPEVTAGQRPVSSSGAGCNLVFNRTGNLFRRAFQYAHRRGIRTCVGTETPLIIPKALQRRLNERRLNPDDPATVRKLYEGLFTRINRCYPIDYYWLWTPEDWTWSGADPTQIEKTMRDIEIAQAALQNIGQPFQLATCGWVLGPPNDRAAFDRRLPKNIALSCINRQVGFTFVEPGFAYAHDRPQWAIPWLEDDPALIIPQLWAGRMRRDAADALAYGCTGLMGIHWRTKILSPNVAALADAAWNQREWNAAFGRPPQLPESLTEDVHVGGQVANYSNNEIADTDEDPVYQTCRWNLNAYRLRVPNGTYAVTLKFCEVHYQEAGKRVFGIKIQGQPKLSGLDVCARAGANHAFDLNFDRIKVANNVLAIEFEQEIEFPFIAGITIRQTSKNADPYTRQINCGGTAYAAYEADLPSIEEPPGFFDRPRDLPVADFYDDWAGAQFGLEAAAELAALCASLDGGPVSRGGERKAHLPRPSNWDRGPGGIIPNRTPWEVEKERYRFVDTMATLRPRIRGNGNLARFDYWLGNFRYLEKIGELSCLRGRLDQLMEELAPIADHQQKLEMIEQDILPLRLSLARLWEQAMTLMLATVSTPGEMGTIANLEQHVRLHNKFLSLHDEALMAITGRPLPEDVHPTTEYCGPPRLIVPTAGADVAAGATLTLKLIVLDKNPADRVTLSWRQLGHGQFQTIDATHVARGVYSVTLPPASGLALEYFVTARTLDNTELHWPAAAPELCHTLVVTPEQN